MGSMTREVLTQATPDAVWDLAGLMNAGAAAMTQALQALGAPVLS